VISRPKASSGSGSNRSTTNNHLINLLAGEIAGIEAGWGVGTFRAIAEFTRDPGGPVELHQTAVRAQLCLDLDI
jgi:hypothetical protein